MQDSKLPLSEETRALLDALDPRAFHWILQNSLDSHAEELDRTQDRIGRLEALLKAGVTQTPVQFGRALYPVSEQLEQAIDHRVELMVRIRFLASLYDDIHDFDMRTSAVALARAVATEHPSRE